MVREEGGGGFPCECGATRGTDCGVRMWGECVRTVEVGVIGSEDVAGAGECVWVCSLSCVCGGWLGGGVCVCV